MALPASKIRMPVLPDSIVARPRLVNALRASRARVVLFEAPAGYGKSTLALQWLGSTGTAWLDLDPGDGDVLRFCRHAGAALAEALPRSGAAELTHATDAVQWFEDLVLLFEEKRDLRCTLVLDNFETIAPSDPVRDLLADWIRRPVGGLRLCITSRVPPRLKLRRLVERGEACVLRQADLAFDLEEFVAAARLRVGEALSEAELEQAWLRTGGWCIHIGLGWTGGRSDPDLGYVNEEVLDGLPPPLAEYLTSTAVLDTLSAEGAAALGLGDQHEAACAALARFGIPHTQTESGPRIHAVVRTILQQILRERWTPGQRVALAKRADAWFRGLGRPEAALEAWLDLGLYADALRVFNEVHLELIERNLQGRYAEWLDRIPHELRGTHDYLRIRMRYLSYTGNNRRLLEEFNAAQAAGHIRPEGAAYRGLWGLSAWARAHLGTEGQYERILAEWRALEPDVRAGDPIGLSAHLSLYLAALYELRPEAARHHLESARAFVPPDSLTQDVNLSNNGANIDEAQGRCGAALEIYEANLERCRRAGERVYYAVNLVNAAQALLSLGRYAEALDAARRCLEASRDAGAVHIALLAYAARVRGEALWKSGRRSEGLAALESAYQHFADYNRSDQVAVGLLLDAWDPRPASPRVPEEAIPPRGSATRVRLEYAVCAGYRALDAADPQAVLEAAREVNALAADLPPWNMAASFLSAWAKEQRGEDAEADFTAGLKLAGSMDAVSLPNHHEQLFAWIVTRAAGLGTLPPALRIWVERGPALDWTAAFQAALDGETRTERAAALLAVAADLGLSGIQPPAILAGHAGVAAYQAASQAAPLPPLIATLFGTSQFIVRGAVLRFQRRAARRLLIWLLVDHPSPVHEEVLIDGLWPDAEFGRGKASLQTAINECRRVLDPYHQRGGRSYVLYDDERYRLDLPPGSMVDAHRCDALPASLLPESQRQIVNREDRIGTLREALGLYVGELVADEPYAEFVVEARERFRARFLEATLLLARELHAADAPGALHALERGLAVDPLWSEGVAALMDELEAKGRPLRAIGVYRTHRERLRSDLDLEPEPELVRRYLRLSSRG